MINLLPATEKEKIRKDYRLAVLSVCFSSAFFVLAVAVLSFSPIFFVADSKYQEILAESRTKEVLMKQFQEQEMRKIVAGTNAKIILLKATSTPSAPQLFRKILDVRPVGVSITGFSYDTASSPGKKVNSSFVIALQGMAESRTALLSFVDALNKEKSFSSVDLPLSNLISDADVSYSLNIMVAPVNAKQI